MTRRRMRQPQVNDSSARMSWSTAARFRRLVLPATLCAVWCAGGCGQPTGAPEKKDASAGIVKTAEKGPVTMTVSVDHGEITIADRLHLTVEVVAKDGVDVTMPSFGEDLDAFAIRDFRDSNAEKVPGGRRWVQNYDLDLFVSGTYPVPPMTATFVDRRKGDQDGEAIETSITTEGFDVTVASLMEGDFDPTQIRDIKAPASLPLERTWVWLWWTLGVVASVVGVIMLVVWLVRRSRRPTPVVVIPAHEWAFDALQQLISDQLVEQGMVHEFYFRLSMIVREYIERRFHLMASEWTTEEFLVHVQRSEVLAVEYRDMLGGFLEACDRVKFALYEPTTGEIEGAFNAARDFVAQTAEPDEPKPAKVAA